MQVCLQFFICLFTFLFTIILFTFLAGHEIASHTVTHSDGKGFDDVKWADELIGLAEMLVSIVLRSTVCLQFVCL